MLSPILQLHIPNIGEVFKLSLIGQKCNNSNLHQITKNRYVRLGQQKEESTKFIKKTQIIQGLFTYYADKLSAVLEIPLS